ncbi:MAG: hypothetical protein ABI920_18460 [Casimicrobiaceae bacterium]
MSPPNKIRLLVLSPGTQVGQNVLATLARRRPDVHVVAISSVATEPALFDLDAVFIAPETAADPDAFEARLLAVMESERIDLVIPCRDDDVVFLAGLRERRPALARHLLCGSRSAAEVIVDKWSSHEFSRAHGLPFAACLIASPAEVQRRFVATYGLPLVAKPRRGYAAIDVFLLHTEAQVATMLARNGYVVQEFLGDPQALDQYLASMAAHGVPLYHSFERVKHSIQALIAPDGSIVHVITTLNERFMRRSKVVRADPDPTARMIGERCAHAFAAQGWRGPLNVQCEKNARGEILIHEFNGRFTGGTIDRWLLGHDEVAAAIVAFTGRSLPAVDNVRPAAAESFQSRVARAADPRDVARLAGDGEWQRSP